ncbi:MAG: bifunctional UDP-N-acetylglucosamine diphosphorylase/glucosamine-1-phosphate N-acetyltransferase GlmU [Syntrophomonadaceae bacterium]|jgi:bifunctional UDP-N-acetylglucosamine pyrophosphorylase/glucosamine-1-phosphate N-acetyltransferase|nr:bifunctional UDP-N-acetylglucosamine diphosphorylase/glucosamine-1-phosphate N-acetyltransferase GlmU [Syntrophomonadaceae bacterium]
MEKLAAIILAAGKGTRMRSRMPKVLHQVAGQYMVSHVLAAAREAGVECLVVVTGHEAELVEKSLGSNYFYAYQQKQLGTGHAVMQAEAKLPEDIDLVLVLSGDTPLLTTATLKNLLDYHREMETAATILTAFPEDPAGYGRVLREAGGRVIRIVEEKDATPKEREIREVNAGAYCFERQHLFKALKRINPANAQGEYYLTDVIGILAKDGLSVAAVAAADPREFQGINNRVQLAGAEQVFRQRINEELMLAGVTILHPESTFIEKGVVIGQDTVIFPFTFIKGNTVIGSGCQIGPYATLTDCRLGEGVVFRHSVADHAMMEAGCQVGPFAYLRPGALLREGVKVGDFVEIKNSDIGPGSKVPHLSYIGDTTLGRGVNIGAGTITCNYDGINKWETVIHDGAFIGSNTNLVAPVKIGAFAVTGAGSTITKDIPPEALGVARSRQVNIEGWAKKKLRINEQKQK